MRSRATELINTIKKAIADHGKNEARKAEERKAFAARGAMDVDSGPFANVSPDNDGQLIDPPSMLLYFKLVESRVLLSFD